MASSTKPVLGVAAMMMIEEGLMSPSDPVSKYIPEFADMKVAVPVQPTDGDGSKEQGKSKDKGKDKDEWTEEEVAEWLEKNKDKLSEEGWGKGKEDAPAYRLVPVDTPVTIHHLLTHTSGLTGSGVVSVGRHTKDDTLATYIPKLA